MIIPVKAGLQQPLQYHRLYGLTLASDYPFANRLAPATGPADLEFRCVHEAPVSMDWRGTTPAFAHGLRLESGEPLSTIVRQPDFDVFHFSEVTDFYLWDDRILCHVLDPEYRFMVEVHLLGQVFALWLERRHILALHAAAVVVDGGAVAFLASNKGGKSGLAATFMQAGFPLLTDDVLPVEHRSGAFLGRPGYPQMRMWPDLATHLFGSYESLEIVHPLYDKRRVPVDFGGFGVFCQTGQPIRALYLPERRSSTDSNLSVTITPLSQAEAMIELIRCSFLESVPLSLGWQPRRMERLGALVARTPVYRLSYPSGWNALPRVRETVLVDLRTNSAPAA